MPGKKDNNESTASSRSRRLFWVILLNAGISIAEVAGGLFANSLALISDAIHNISDVLSSALAWLAVRTGNRKSTLNKTFGFKRIEILAAFLNSLILVVISAFLVFEAISRFSQQQHVNGLVMSGVAVIGFLANFLGVLLLKRDITDSLNIKATYLHLLGDSISSLAVVFGGILIYYFNIFWVDPAMTIFIAVYIFIETYKILRQAVDILMQGTPSGIDLIEIKRDLEAYDEILNIHHVHAWNMTENEIQFECHIDLNKDIPVGETAVISRKIKGILKEKYGIRHATIQYEYNDCHDKSMISH
jgi:cobalt-zinc-cadmium efflux system protein